MCLAYMKYKSLFYIADIYVFLLAKSKYNNAPELYSGA